MALCLKGVWELPNKTSIIETMWHRGIPLLERDTDKLFQFSTEEKSCRPTNTTQNQHLTALTALCLLISVFCSFSLLPLWQVLHIADWLQVEWKHILQCVCHGGYRSHRASSVSQRGKSYRMNITVNSQQGTKPTETLKVPFTPKSKITIIFLVPAALFIHLFFCCELPSYQAISAEEMSAISRI